MRDASSTLYGCEYNAPTTSKSVLLGWRVQVARQRLGFKVEPEPNAGRPVLDHGVDGEGKLTNGAHREPASARLVTRKSGFVCEENRGTFAGEPVRRRRP